MGSSSLTLSLFLLSVVFWQFDAAYITPVPVNVLITGNAILPCKTDSPNAILTVEWYRPDKKSAPVLLYSDKKIQEKQLEAYKGRVSLRNPEKRDLSLVLKNVVHNDTGKYECRVELERDPHPPIITSRPLTTTILTTRVDDGDIDMPLHDDKGGIHFILITEPISIVVLTVEEPRNAPLKVKPGNDVILPCKDPDQGEITIAEWKRNDLGGESVLLYRDGQIKQLPSYTDRVDLLVGQLKKGDASLILQNATIDDSGTYLCRVVTKDLEEKLMSIVCLFVAPRPPDPFPVWAIILLVLLVLLIVAAGVSFYFWLCWKPVQEHLEVDSGEKFVLLPFKVPRYRWCCKYRRSVGKVEWKDRDNRTVHVYQNGSYQPGEQDRFYKDRTKMDENLLKTGDLSLTLSWPTDGDGDSFTCRVSSRKGDVLMEKRVWLKVKVHQEEVKPGVESVLLPCRTTGDLDGHVRVEWRDGDNRKVHVYQDGSDQPDDQHPSYKGRTKMDGNPLETKDLSLTLKEPSNNDSNTFTCITYSKKGDVLMKKQVQLKVKAQDQVEVEPGVESVLLPCRTTESLDGDVRVEWKDSKDRTVHVYQDGSDHPGEQDRFCRTRTKTDKNLLENKDLSLNLKWPGGRDREKFTCRVYDRDRDVPMEKNVHLQVKVQEQVEVKSGVESVKLPWTITESLDGDVRVEWRDGENRKVHVYQNGSDQPGDQDQDYRTRTKMDKNLLETKDLSLTLNPTRSNTFTCRVSNRKRGVLMDKEVQLQVKGTIQVQPDDTRTRRNSIDPTPLMADQSV